MVNNASYSSVAKLLHWLVASLIISQYVIAELAEYAGDSGEVVQKLALLANHKSIGMTVLFLSALRLTWRLFNKPPALPQSMPSWQQTASHITHWAIYALIFALPLSGWLMSSANAYSVSWFNVFVFPDLVGADKSLASLFHNVHEILGKLLFCLVLLHVFAALKHHFFDKDGVLTRMASWLSWCMFIIVIVIVLYRFAWTTQIEQPAISSNETSEQVDQVNQPLISSSDLPLWNIDYQQSYIRFTGDQAGAPFEGLWVKWTADMQFDSTRLDDSGFDVLIDTSQVDSGDEERDGYIVGSDFFDVENHKTARFLANKFTKRDEGGFSSNGTLSIKGLSKSVLFTFTVNENDGFIVLEGRARLDRLSWNIGLGDWQDPTWVGQDVEVLVKVTAASSIVLGD